MSASDVEIPGRSIDADAGTDLLTPLKNILTGINALGGPGDSSGSAFSAPSQSVAIIESGATSLTKWWSAAVGALGGATAITAAASGFWNSQTGATRIALLSATAGVIAAATVAIAWIVTSDVRGRAVGAAAIYEARSRVTEQLLEVAYRASAVPAVAAPAPGVAPAVPAVAKPAPGVGPAVPPAVDGLVSTALEKALTPVSATLTDIASAVHAVDESVSNLDQRTALIALGVKQGIPGVPPAEVTTADGMQGRLMGVSYGPNSGSTVYLDVMDEQTTVHHAIPPQKISRF
jgi:hypothetical protein